MKTIKDYNYSYNHVKQRLKERHNLEIDKDFYDRMNKNIKPYISNYAFSFEVDNNGEQEIHPMFIKNKIVKVVYSLSKERITTVLPPIRSEDDYT
jgi:predicted component of type VI protein secretion system